MPSSSSVRPKVKRGCPVCRSMPMRPRKMPTARLTRPRTAVLGNSAVRGLVSLAVGIFLGLIGIDLQTGQPRFTFGLTELLDGINVIVVAVGLFAVGETLYLACFK